MGLPNDDKLNALLNWLLMHVDAFARQMHPNQPTNQPDEGDSGPASLMGPKSLRAEGSQPLCGKFCAAALRLLTQPAAEWCLHQRAASVMPATLATILVESWHTLPLQDTDLTASTNRSTLRVMAKLTLKRRWLLLHA